MLPHGHVISTGDDQRRIAVYRRCEGDREHGCYLFRHLADRATGSRDTPNAFSDVDPSAGRGLDRDQRSCGPKEAAE